MIELSFRFAGSDLESRRNAPTDGESSKALYRGARYEKNMFIVDTPLVRKGQMQHGLSRLAYRERFMTRYADPAFRAEDDALRRLERIAWQAYSEGLSLRRQSLRAEVTLIRTMRCQQNGGLRVSGSRLRRRDSVQKRHPREF